MKSQLTSKSFVVAFCGFSWWKLFSLHDSFALTNTYYEKTRFRIEEKVKRWETCNKLPWKHKSKKSVASKFIWDKTLNLEMLLGRGQLWKKKWSNDIQWNEKARNERDYYILWSSNSLPIQINWFERETACLVFRTRFSECDEVFFCWRFRSNEWYFKTVDWTWIKRREKQWVFKLALLKQCCCFSKDEMKWLRWLCWRWWWYHPCEMRQKQHPMGNKLVSFPVQTYIWKDLNLFRRVPCCLLLKFVQSSDGRKIKEKNHLFRKMKFRSEE